MEIERDEAAAIALASVRLEGLDPGRAEPLLQRWARGELTDEQLAEAERRLIAGQSIAEFLPDAADH
jgi:hypothetical protein